MITQTLAIFQDAYRELADRKLFWIVLILSAVAVVGFAGFKADDAHLTYFGFNFPAIGIPPRALYKSIFSGFVIGLWLTWFATVLALISTASIFPDFIAFGSIDLFLSKPISRLRLFFTKYIAGLLFVILQVVVFTVMAFFVLGLRGGGWFPGLFWAIPIVLCFFSYLFSICVFFGVLWRSTLAAFFLTLLFWLICYALGTTELVLLNFKTDAQLTLSRLNLQIDTYDKRIAMLEPAASATTRPTTQPGRLLTDFKETRQRLLKEQDETINTLHSLDRWHGIFYTVKTVFPKTTDTIELLNRILLTREEISQLSPEDRRARRNKNKDKDDDEAEIPRQRTDVEFQNKLRDRSIAWIVGTSLLFEAVVLSLAAWIFHRRDF
jgi:ABC-type transport system involved in multi-copper enzyme maturation permease subunit